MFANRGVAFKLIFLSSVCCAAIFIAIVAYNYRVSKQMLEKNMERNAESLVDSLVYRIETVLAPVQKIPENLSYFLEHGSYRKDELLQILRKVVENNREIYGATIAFEPRAFDGSSLYFAPSFHKENGAVKFSYLGSPSYRYFFLDWYQIPKETGRPGWTEPYIVEGEGHMLMATYSVPFYRTLNGKRQLMGIVTADVSLEWLRNIVSSVKVLQTGYGFLLSKNGTVVTHPSRDLIMNETFFSIAETRGDRAMRDVGRRMIKGEKGLIPYRNIHGTDCWMYYAPVPSSGWSLSVLFPRNELTADIVRLNRTVFSWGLAGIVLLSLAVAFIARSITGPLSAISKAADEIGSGNLDVELPAARSGDEIGRLTDSFSFMRDSLKDYILRLTETTAAKERIESELKIARDIQMGILPKIFPPFPDRPDEFDLYALMEAAKEVGGDFYDFFYCDDTHLCFVIGDVSGKGVPASLFMAVTKTLIKTTATAISDPGAVLTKVNNDLSRGNDACMFVTIFLGLLDTGTGELLFANGGHNPPLVVAETGEAEFLAVPKGLVLGAMEDYLYRTDKIQLKPGESLFMYTDGVTEAMNAGEELFSEERLKSRLNSLRGSGVRDMISGVMEELVFFADSAAQSDDITMLAVRYKGGTRRSASSEPRM